MPAMEELFPSFFLLFLFFLAIFIILKHKLQIFYSSLSLQLTIEIVLQTKSFRFLIWFLQGFKFFLFLQSFVDLRTLKKFEFYLELESFLFYLWWSKDLIQYVFFLFFLKNFFLFHLWIWIISVRQLRFVYSIFYQFKHLFSYYFSLCFSSNQFFYCYLISIESLFLHWEFYLFCSQIQ